MNLVWNVEECTLIIFHKTSPYQKRVTATFFLSSILKSDSDFFWTELTHTNCSVFVYFKLGESWYLTKPNKIYFCRQEGTSSLCLSCSVFQFRFICMLWDLVCRNYYSSELFLASWCPALWSGWSMPYSPFLFSI